MYKKPIRNVFLIQSFLQTTCSDLQRKQVKQVKQSTNVGCLHKNIICFSLFSHIQPIVLSAL